MTIDTQELISICLGVIKKKAVNQLQSCKAVLLDEDRIRWVVTVPAIWVSDDEPRGPRKSRVPRISTVTRGMRRTKEMKGMRKMQE